MILDFQRTLATNFDPNRDHTKLARQQTRDIKKWFSSFSPHVAIDMHEYNGRSRYAGNYTNGADGMFSAAKVSTSHTAMAVSELTLPRTSTSTPLSAICLRMSSRPPSTLPSSLKVCAANPM
jgi:hypothetical protein